MSKQHTAKIMFDQSIVYLFNSYIEQGFSPEDSSSRVAKDIEEIHQKHIERGVLVNIKQPEPSYNHLDHVESIMKMVNTAKGFNYTGKRPIELSNDYNSILSQIRNELIKMKNNLK